MPVRKQHLQLLSIASVASVGSSVPLMGDYMNRKCFYSILLQGIVDEMGRFIDVFAGPPGKLHDARMLRASNFHTKWQGKMDEYS